MVNTFRNLISQAARKKIDASYRTYVAVALVAAMLLSTYNVFAVPTPGLVAVGPTSNATGYPSWYKDSNGTRLELCLDGGLNPICGYLPGDIPNPAAPITVPDNYPATAEAFYMLGSALMETDSATGGRAILVLALEAAFSGGTVVSGDQITFGRIRIWIDNLIPNAQYRVTHPYGVDNFTADPVFGRRMIRYVEDIGIGAPGDFSGALNSRIGPFLFWDPAIAPAAPAGYIGDPDILHEVAGSPLNTNFFRVEGPAGSFPGSVDQCADPALGDDPIATDDCIQMDQFSLIGKYATNADVNANRATYTQGNANGGQIDVFANTEPGMDIQVDGFGNPILTTDGNGYYFTQVSYTGNPPAQLQVINTSDTPDTSKTISVTDLVTITKAEFITATGTLRVDALSSDTYNDPILTVAGFGDLDNNNGRLEVSGLAIPPQNVTVTSAKGGSATAAVAVNVVPPIPVPTITGFTPINGVVGTIVTITGTNFNSASDVSFNGIPAVFTVDSDTSISATVPGTATTGLVSVTTPDGTAASIGNYTVIVPPTITNFTPSNGLVGASVTITGTEFTSATSVMFNGMAATFTVDSDTQITAQIPDGASSGPISVANPAGTVISAANFTVDVPWPLVVSIVRASTNPSNANTVNFTVTFSKPVTGVDGSDFSVLNAGTTMTGASVTSVSGANGTATRTVSVSTGTGAGSLRLDLIDNDTIRDASLVRLGGTGLANGNFTSGESYTLDKVAPTVVSIVRANADPTTASTLNFMVTFSESVIGVDKFDFSLVTTGSISGANINSVSGTGLTRTVNVNSISGAGTIRLDLIDNDTIRDTVNNRLGGTGTGNGNYTTGEFYTKN